MDSYFEGSTAIVGGGLAGLSAANRLASKGIPVTVYDMGTRGPGSSPLLVAQNAEEAFRDMPRSGICQRSAWAWVDCRPPSHQAKFKPVNRGPPLVAGGHPPERSAWAGTGCSFDHGCQFITASTDLVGANVKDWEFRGFLKLWQGRLGTLDAKTGVFKDRTDFRGPVSKAGQGFCNILCKGLVYVGSSCMVDACSAMYQLIGIEVKWDTRVTTAVRQLSGSWEVTAETGGARGRVREYKSLHKNLILADQMNVRPGAHGYVDLREHNSIDLPARVRSVARSPRYSLMLAMRQSAVAAPLNGVCVTSSPIIEWISRDTSKPGRERDNDLECWVAVTTEAYAQALLAEMPLLQGDQRYLPQTKDALDNIAARIWEALKAVMAPFMEGEPPEPVYLRAQRWASAFKADPLEEGCVSDVELGLAACGDFCICSSAEGAIMSGIAAADIIAARAAAAEAQPSPSAA